MHKLFCVLLSLSSFAHAAPLAWPSSAIANLHRAKTVKDLVCVTGTSSAGDELCELYKDSYDVEVNFKLETTKDSVLIFKGEEGAVVRVERTENASQFMVNGQLINLKKYSDQERLGFAIEAAMTPKSARKMSIFDQAYATSDIEPSIKPAIQGLAVFVGPKGNLHPLTARNPRPSDTLTSYRQFARSSSEN